MKIWFLNHYAVPPTRYGNTRHFSFASVLQRMGHETRIVSSSFGHRTGITVDVPTGRTTVRQDCDGVPFTWVKTTPYSTNGLARLINMLTYAWRASRIEDDGKPDIVLGSSPHPFAALAAQRIARRHGVPFVLEIRDLWPATLLDLSGASRFHPFIMLLAAMERYLYRSADLIVTVLPGAVSYVAERGGRADRIVCIPNGVEVERLPAATEPRESDVFTLMFAGSHGPANGLDVALEAVALLNARGLGDRIRFRLIGEGPAKKSLIEHAGRLGLKNVSFEDAVPKSEVQKVMAEADAFLMILRQAPVFRWGISPNKLWDYMAASRPIVFAVDTPFNPVADASCGVTPGEWSVESIADAIERVYRMPYQERRAMGERGRRYVTTERSLERMAKTLAERLEILPRASQTLR